MTDRPEMVSVTLSVPKDLWVSLEQTARSNKYFDTQSLISEYIERGVRKDSDKQYLLDTCVFNKLVEGILKRSDIPQDGRYVITHAQVDEINRTSDEYREKRSRLILEFLTGFNVELINTSVFLADFSRIGMAFVSDSDLYEQIKEKLDKRNQKKLSNTIDAVLAVSAIEQHLILVTLDSHLSDVAKDHGCQVVYLEGQAEPKQAATPNQPSTFLASIAGLGDSGQVDISEHDEDILKHEIDPIHGWTTKPDRL